MNQKRGSMIIVLCTLACVSILIYNDFTIRTTSNDNYESEQNMEEKKTNSPKADDKKTEGHAYDITERSLKMKLRNMQQARGQDMYACYETLEEEKVNQKETKSKSKVNKPEKKDSDVEGKKGTQVTARDVQGAKVVWNDISSEDKSKLMKVAKKLSAFDYVKVKESLNKNDSQSITEILQLLRDRLSESDFKEINDMWNKYGDSKNEKK